MSLAKLSLSYSSMADIYALAETENEETKKALLELAQNLEQVGVGYYNGEEFMYRDSQYGMEIVSMDDYVSENEDDEEDY